MIEEENRQGEADDDDDEQEEMDGEVLRVGVDVVFVPSSSRWSAGPCYGWAHREPAITLMA